MFVTGLKKYWSFLLKDKKFLILSLIIMLITTSFELILPYINKLFIDDALLKKNYDFLITISIVIFIVHISKPFISFIGMYILELSSIKITNTIKEDLLKHVIHYEKSSINNINSTILQRRISSEVDTVGTSLFKLTIDILLDIIKVVGGLILILSISKFVFAITFTALLVFAFFNKKVHRDFRPLYSEIINLNNGLSKYIVQIFQGIFSIKNFNKENDVQAQYNILLSEIFKKQKIYKYTLYKGTVIPSTISEFIAFAVKVICGYLIIKDTMTIGEFVALVAYLSLVFAPMSKVINNLILLRGSWTSFERIMELYNTKNEDTSWYGKTPFKFDNAISICDVSKKYNDSDNILKNLNMKLIKGKKYALIGHTGCGKTTLVNILLGHIKDYAGQVMLDDSNLKDLELSSLRNKILYVGQNCYIFDETIRYNLTLGDKFEDNDILESIKKAQLDSFIKNLPNGIDSKITELSGNISGGEKQRILFARTFLHLKNKQLIILDEASANIDAENERIILDNLFYSLSGQTVIFITHKLSLIKNADEILFLSDGHIKGSGKHDLLLAENEEYRNLYKEFMIEV